MGLGGLGVGLQLASEVTDEMAGTEELADVVDEVAKLLVSWKVDDAVAVSVAEILEESEAEEEGESLCVVETRSEEVEVLICSNDDDESSVLVLC